MQPRTTRLTAPASSAAVIGLLFLASACAPPQDPKAAAGTASATPSAKAPARPLTTASLKGLAFKDGEVPQAYEPIEVQEPQPEGSGRSFPPVSVPACQPLVDVRTGKGSSAHVFQIFNWKENLMGGGSTLASYESDQAQQRFAELKQALSTCRSYEGEGYVGPFKATVTTETPPRVGDEAVAFREIIPMGPEQPGDRNEQFIVVRTGNAIATFSELSVGKGLSFPSELISRQVERLQNAQRS
ncbi:hypothetical protein [Streptomyces sp. NPDC094032]|uniref:hypothetical protein n=1 Tax=Streptomyces sp. NPDC094032 TaxID=3155308 RepID=UPI003332973B